MIANVGEFSLSLAILAAMGALFACVAAVRLESDRMFRAVRWLFGLFAALLSVSVMALAVAMINADFSIAYVASYTERALPFGYKLAALWAGQEGSVLLWAWLLAVMSFLFALNRRELVGKEGAATFATVAIVCGFFAALLLFAANPFKLIEVVPEDGRGLNPLLQDPAMIAHPPVLFLGYAGFTFPFALLVGALIAGRRDNQWIAATRRWLLASWLFLTIGIILGAQWAYIELGWGGYWGWDPVENASLLPWLTATAVIHSIMAQQHRGMFKKWNAVLIALSFILCIFGTYVTRSGVIDSVHSFGKSLIGTFFLVFMLVTILFTTLLLIARRRVLEPEQELSGLVGKEGGFLATNVLLLGMMLVTLVGTMLPVITRTFSGKEMTVGAPFYNKVVAPMGMLLVALMAFGPLLTYGKDAAGRIARSMLIPAGIAIVAVIVAVAMKLTSIWALLAVAIVTLGVACVLIDLAKAWWAHERSIGALVRLIDSNHRRYGGQLVHMGVLMIIAGIVGSSVFGHKEHFQLTPGQEVAFGGQKLKYVAMHETRHANYSAVQAEMLFTDANGNATTLRPQRRFYDKSEQPHTEVALSMDLKRDVYLTLAGWEKSGAVTAIEAIINPLVSWIWIGGIVMSVGAIFCMIPKILSQPAVVTAAEDDQNSLRVARLAVKA